MNEVTIDLRTVRFGDAEKVLAQTDHLAASVFRYRSGVAALRIRNSLGHIVLLPFQGQQIWDAAFLGRTLTMRSMFTEPVPTQDYLRTYGAFFIHCGVSAMGNPSSGDTHPLHGELPNAPYQEARLVVGEDAGGDFMALTGSYRHAVAFAHNHLVQPSATLRSDSSSIEMTLEVSNLRPVPMELMYLAHINFLPQDGALLLDTVPADPEHMRIRADPPPGYVFSAEHRELIAALRREPAGHRHITPGLRIDPEIVLALDSRAGSDGWAHSLQLHPDGQADFVSHRPDELGHGIRWMSRTGDQDALGLMLPATAESDGYIAEKQKGNLVIIPPLGSFRCDLAFGALGQAEATAMAQRIEAIRSPGQAP